MSNLHAHIETYTTDCDGGISRDYIATMTDDELAGQDEPNYFGELEFRDRIVANLVNAYSLLDTGTLTVRRLSDGDIRMSWAEVTDEGQRQAEATFCTDDCDTEESHYRDHAAEAMGY